MVILHTGRSGGTSEVHMLRVVIRGKPYGQARHRARGYVVGKNARIQMYDPDANKANKKRAQVALAMAIDERGAEWNATGPMRVIIDARWPCLNPLARSKRMQMWRAKKPDADNVAKWVLDAFQPMAFVDDNQVAYLEVRKSVCHQDDIARTIVTVERMLDTDLPPR